MPNVEPDTDRSRRGRRAAVGLMAAAALGATAVPAVAQSGRMTVLYDVPASVAAMVDGADTTHLSPSADDVYEQGYADTAEIPGRLVAKVTTGPASVRTPNIVGMGATALADLLTRMINASSSTTTAANFSWNTSHIVFVDEIGPAEIGAGGDALAQALQTLSREPSAWPLPGGGTGSDAQHVHLYIRSVQSMITFPDKWTPLWTALPLVGGVWLEAYSGSTLPLTPWAPEQWLAWPRAFATRFQAEHGDLDRLHVLMTGSPQAGLDQASQWTWARVGEDPLSACAVLRNGPGAYRLSATTAETESNDPSGPAVPATTAFDAQYRLTFPLSGAVPADGAPGGCTPSPVLSGTVAAALGADTSGDPGILEMGNTGVALGTGSVSADQITADQTTDVAVTLPGGDDPFGIAGALASAGAAGETVAGEFWSAADPQLTISGAGVTATSAPLVPGSDGSYTATVPVHPTTGGPLTVTLDINGQAIRAALGAPADLALSLAPYAGTLGAQLSNLIDNPTTWRLAIPVGPSGDPGSSLVGALFPVPAIAAAPAITLPAHNPATWVQVHGTGFTPQTTFTWATTRLATVDESATQARIRVPAGLLTAQGTATLSAANPAPGGGTSAPAPVTIGPPAPSQVRTRPRVRGLARLGAVLTCTTGTWSMAPSAYRIAWLRNGVPIAGATTAALRVVPADLGQSLACVVTASHYGALSRAASGAVRPGPALTVREVRDASGVLVASVIVQLPWRTVTVDFDADRGDGYRVVSRMRLREGSQVVEIRVGRGRVAVLAAAAVGGQVLVSRPLRVGPATG